MLKRVGSFIACGESPYARCVNSPGAALELVHLSRLSASRELGLYPPPCGEGIGGLRPPFFVRRTPMRSIGYGEARRVGVVRFCVGGATQISLRHPPPHPSPTRGEGADRVRRSD